MTTEYTWDEVAKHNTKEDCWLVISGDVRSSPPYASIPSTGLDNNKDNNRNLPYPPQRSTDTLARVPAPFQHLHIRSTTSHHRSLVLQPDHTHVSPAHLCSLPHTQPPVPADTTSPAVPTRAPSKVYNLTDFLGDHPGGVKAPLMYAGKDATEEFEMLHNSKVLNKCK